MPFFFNKLSKINQNKHYLITTINTFKMITQHNLLSDTEIICLIDNNSFLGWQCLYNKYALMMYVAILWVTNDKILTEEIMSLLFAQLKTNKTLLTTNKTLCSSLLQHTYSTAYKMLKINDMRFCENTVKHEPCPMLTDLLSDATAITEAEAKLTLRVEVNRIRDKYSKKMNPLKEKKQIQHIIFLNEKAVATAN